PKGHPLTSYQLRVTLFRAAGSTASPTVTRLGAVASDPINSNPYVPSSTTMTKTIDLHVPSFSQEIHAGQYPQFDGGGEAWCSPTSTSMVVAYWGRARARRTTRTSTATTRTSPTRGSTTQRATRSTTTTTAQATGRSTP